MAKKKQRRYVSQSELEEAVYAKVCEDVETIAARTREIASNHNKLERLFENHQAVCRQAPSAEIIELLRKDVRTLRTELNEAAAKIESQKVALSEAVASTDSLTDHVNTLSEADGAQLSRTVILSERVQKLESAPKDQSGVTPEVWRLIEDRILRSVDHAVMSRMRPTEDGFGAHAVRLAKIESHLGVLDNVKANRDEIAPRPSPADGADAAAFRRAARELLPEWQFMAIQNRSSRPKPLEASGGNVRVDADPNPITAI